MLSVSQDEATKILASARRGEPGAADRLFPVVYDRLHALAGSYFKGQPHDHTLQPTALVHEAYIKMVDHSTLEWNDRAHFMAIAATAMRQVLINHAEARNAQKRGGGVPRISLDQSDAATDAPAVDVLDLHHALVQLADLDERKARLVEMRFFGGMTVDEAAAVLSISTTTAESDWRMARAWLSARLTDGDAP